MVGSAVGATVGDSVGNEDGENVGLYLTNINTTCSEISHDLAFPS